MRKINVGIIGFGTVGSGVIKLLKLRQGYLQDKFKIDFAIKTICDGRIRRLDTKGTGRAYLTTKIEDVLDDPEIEVVVELIGGLHPAKEIITTALKRKKHVVTANKAIISNFGKDLFKLARKNNVNLYFESAVGAGIPIIKSITEGIAGNKIRNIYAIINGTCNFILTEMTKNKLSFSQALALAQKKGYAESNPTLDINGMDSTHKLAILIYLTFNKFVQLDDIYTEGITHISHNDIEYAEGMGLTIKLLTIAKKLGRRIEARVHPTLIPKDHPLASISGVYNAVFLDADPLGELMLSGQGAGQMSAATGVVSDLINYATRGKEAQLLCNIFTEATNLKIRKIDQVKTKFYIRMMALDKPGVLAKITGILGKYGISINSVSQKAHNWRSAVPVIMLTDYTTEKNLRQSLTKIQALDVVRGKPIAIRMETLK